MDTNILNIKMCLSIIMPICIKHHLSNIWSSILEKVNTEAELKKSVAFIRKPCIHKNNCHQTGGFIVWYIWEIWDRKNSQLSKVSTFLDFIYWFDRDNLNLDSCFFNLVNPEVILPAAHFFNYVYVGRIQTITANIGLSKFLQENVS